MFPSGITFFGPEELAQSSLVWPVFDEKKMYFTHSFLYLFNMYVSVCIHICQLICVYMCVLHCVTVYINVYI